MIGSICSQPNILEVMRIVNIIIMIIKIVIPIILILFMMLEFMRAISSNDSEALQKAKKNAISKMIAAALIFLMPTFVKLVVNIAAPNTDYVECLKIHSKDEINGIYIQNMEKYMEEARTKRDLESYQKAYIYLINIKDIEKRKEYLKELAEIKKEIDEKNQQTADDTPTIFKGPAYETSESDLKYLANVGYCEQYYIDGIKAEISLALNKFEQQTRYKTVADYVRYSRWWACHDTTKSAGKAAVEAVRDVVVNGNRTLPPYVNSHDCIDCSGRCSNGVRGDICKIVTNGITYENIDDIKNRNNYIRGNTVVYNKYGGVHIFYTFPCEKCDPFSYSESLYLKYNNKIQD